MKKLLDAFFLGNKELYEKCIDKNLSYYLERIRYFVETTHPHPSKKELFYIEHLLKNLNKLPQNTIRCFDQMNLFQFFRYLLTEDKVYYAFDLDMKLKELAAYYDFNEVLEPNDLTDYKNTVCYPKSPSGYFGLNNSIHNKILDITTPFKLPETVTREQLLAKAFENTPLVLACKTGHSQAALMLIKKHKELKIDVHQSDSQGMTALHWACFYRDNLLIQHLLDSGAPSYLKNSDGDKPLDLYTMKLDESTEFYSKGTKKRAFLKIPAIDDQTLECTSDDLGKRKKSWRDIAFHMDKVAFHKLQVNLKTINQEIHSFNNKHHDVLKIDSNRVFEILIFYHFNHFINARNRISLDAELLKKLEATSSPKEEKRASRKPTSKENRDFLSLVTYLCSSGFFKTPNNNDSSDNKENRDIQNLDPFE
jgi:hypothetical protein